MDVLARLATEGPDLSGLPGELTELIAACLQRVPRDRPTSSAMLAQLGQFTETRPGAAGEHSYLPDAAMALIAQYQRNPLLASGQPRQEDSGADATSASYTELPASYRPKEKAPRRQAGWRRWVKTHMAWVGWVSVGAALVVGGVILGASLTSSGSAGAGSPPPVAPPTVCGSQDVTNHMLCMNKSQGYPDTTFVVEGQGFQPGQHVVVKLSEQGPPPEHKQLLDVTSTVRAGHRRGWHVPGPGQRALLLARCSRGCSPSRSPRQAASRLRRSSWCSRRARRPPASLPSP